MTTNWIHYFGYGSLVNRDTRPADESALSASLIGWQRVWGHRVTGPFGGQPCTSLSIEPKSCELASQSANSIDGVVVRISVEQLPDLDAREEGYERMVLPASHFVLPEGFDGDVIMVYRSLEENRFPATTDCPILQSYIDCVMAGYLGRFGQDGLLSLMASTKGWGLPTLNDRQAPFYPRHVTVDETHRHLFNQCISQAIKQEQAS